MSEKVAVEPSQRDRAVSRAVDPARERAEMKVQAFLDAARELLAEGADFTLQMVVDRSGQSLRSFYQHFAGKHELLLALFEESVQATRDQIDLELRGIDDPLERLRTFVVQYDRRCLSGTAQYADKPLQSRAMAQFAQQVLIYQPAEATQAFAPLVSLLNELLHDAGQAGAVRTDLDDETAGFILQAIMFHAFVPTIAGTSAPPDPARSAGQLWDLLARTLT